MRPERNDLAARPGEARPRRVEPWLALFCAGTVAFLAYRDLTIPAVRDVEIWLGIELQGRLAQATAPLHWLVFAVAAFGFARRQRWVWPAAISYAIYVAASHLVWNLTSPRGGGAMAGLGQLALFLLPAALLFLLAPARECAERPGGTHPDPPERDPGDPASSASRVD